MHQGQICLAINRVLVDARLAIDTEEGEDTKGRYKFPYGDFEAVHRCGVLTAESRAGQYKYQDIELAAAHRHGMLDALG